MCADGVDDVFVCSGASSTTCVPIESLPHVKGRPRDSMGPLALAARGRNLLQPEELATLATRRWRHQHGRTDAHGDHVRPEPYMDDRSFSATAFNPRTSRPVRQAFRKFRYPASPVRIRQTSFPPSTLASNYSAATGHRCWPRPKNRPRLAARDQGLPAVEDPDGCIEPSRISICRVCCCGVRGASKHTSSTPSLKFASAVCGSTPSGSGMLRKKVP
jgi:hypothetical protein